MPRVLLLTVAGVAVLAAACQLALPALAERQVEKRLERDGGTASASLAAFPAPRLLFGDGDSFEVRGGGLRVDVTERERVLDRLDGFDEVDVRLEDVDADPLAIESFELSRREGAATYRVRVTGETSPREVAAFLGSQAGGVLGGVLGDLAAGRLPGGGDERVPLAIDASVESHGGNAEVTSATGSVAGVPGGPLAELVVEAVVRRL
jgi:hypothetical protein